MWQSKDDIAKDLAFLNDFGVPGDQEPYKFLYSTGRGSKVKQKENHEKFIDSRTGEVINVEDLDVPDTSHKSKGRGTLLGSCLKSKLQLQKQLRLARPLGSGDEAVEFYYRRNKPTESPKPQTEPDSKFEVESINDNISSLNQKFSSNTKEIRLRIKGVRNSTSQCNALMTSLLSKAKENSSIELISNNCNNDVSVGFSVDDNINEFNKLKGEKNLTNDFDPQNVITDPKQNEEKCFLDKERDACAQNTKNKNIGEEFFESVCDKGVKEKKEQIQNRISKENSEDETYFDDDTEKIKKRDKSYRELGEKLRRLVKINSEVERKTVHDFKYLQNTPSSEMKFENKFGVLNNSVATNFHYNENDFPLLRKKN